jgi:hypothetical protein
VLSCREIGVDETLARKSQIGVERDIATIGYADPSDRYSLTVGGTNLSNERYVQSGNSIAASGVVSGVYSRPREWYLRLGVNF